MFQGGPASAPAAKRYVMRRGEERIMFGIGALRESILAMFLVLISSAAYAQTASTVITVYNTKIFADVDFSDENPTTIGKGVELSVIEKGATWYRIQTKEGRQGYIAGAAVTEDKVWGKTLRLPETVYAVEKTAIYNQSAYQGGTIEATRIGTAYSVLGIEGDWFKVRTSSGAVGYVLSKEVTSDQNVARDREKMEQQQAVNAANDAANKLKNCRLTHPEWSAEDCNTISQAKVRLGMSKEQCTFSWGEPTSIRKLIVQSGTRTQWCYGQYCRSSLYFDGEVLDAIQNE
jgi:uncharacterized protein YgiM (DUF1202 family)